MNKEFFIKYTEKFPKAYELFPSRISRLKTGLLVKRDDEIGGVFGGSKRRKYTTLLPTLFEKSVVLIGSEHSNHLLSLTQLLCEFNIRFHVIAKKSHEETPTGNAILLRALCGKRLFLVDRELWGEHKSYAKQLGEYVIEEGAFHEAAIPGACSLAIELAEGGYSDLYLDAGTGFMAAVTTAVLKRILPEVEIHIVSSYVSLHEFEEVVKWVESQIGLAPQQISYNFYKNPWSKYLKTFPAIGVVKDLFSSEGIFLDPIYTPPLFSLAMEQKREKPMVVHSGGVHSSFGFNLSYLN